MKDAEKTSKEPAMTHRQPNYKWLLKVLLGSCALGIIIMFFVDYLWYDGVSLGLSNLISPGYAIGVTVSIAVFAKIAYTELTKVVGEYEQ